MLGVKAAESRRKSRSADGESPRTAGCLYIAVLFDVGDFLLYHDPHGFDYIVKKAVHNLRLHSAVLCT